MSPPSPAPRPEPIAAAIDGVALARAYAGGAEALVQQADALNAINVFPVPDGDTGTNMSLTMRAAVDAVGVLDSTAGATIVQVATAAASGTLMGARGNSGVILSQIVAGFVDTEPSTAVDRTLDARGLADALERGRAAAYRVVSTPKEGTILTAITAAAAAATACANGAGSFEAALSAATDAAADAAARTPELLPVLKEAGVVDAGAEGLAVLLAGMLAGLRGQPNHGGALDLGAIDASWLSATRRSHGEGAVSGFCTEFVIEGAALDAATVRAGLRDGAESLLVVGGGDLVRVHLHTKTPDAALSYARTLGAVSREKIDDMDAQFRHLAAGSTEVAPDEDDAPAVALAVVAVGAGEGIAALLASLGAARVVRGGQTMNPSAGEIRDKIIAARAASVIILPNNKNIILAAEQAAASLRATRPALVVTVVPTTSIPQGVAALVAMNGEATLQENVDAMSAASASVRTIEVTYAARATQLKGAAVREGQPIGLVEGELAVAGDSVAEVARACIARLLAERPASLITIYVGDTAASPECSEDSVPAHPQPGNDDVASSAARSPAAVTVSSPRTSAAEDLATALRDQFGLDVEVVDGGQPHYPYVIGVE